MRPKGDHLSAIFILLNLKIRLGVCVGVCYFISFITKYEKEKKVRIVRKIKI